MQKYNFAVLNQVLFKAISLALLAKYDTGSYCFLMESILIVYLCF